MKSRLGIFILIAWLFTGCSPSPEGASEVVFHEGEPHLLLMNPTIQNIDRFTFLVEEGIFPLPEEMRIVGVYHQDASYNYNQTARHILNEGLSHITLYGISTPMNADRLFEHNAQSEDFSLLFNNSKGVIFLGGPDIPPATYGEAFSLLTVVTDPHRHYLELSFLFHLLGSNRNPGYVPLLEQNPDYPILGICLGMQTMNVATGGTMYQDIPWDLYQLETVEEVLALEPHQQHRNYHSYYRLDNNLQASTFHPIRVGSDSHMQQVAGSSDVAPTILSSHHQAIKELGQGFRTTAWCMDDKIIEAIEHDIYPNVIGIQFHPEVPWLYDSDHKITFRPGETATQSFLDLYSGDLGETFHRNFWAHIAAMYQ